MREEMKEDYKLSENRAEHVMYVQKKTTRNEKTTLHFKISLT